MPKTIDILTVMDPLAFEDNNYTLNTPISSLPWASPSTMSNTWMIVENGSLASGQASSHLSITASGGDTIRWWDTSVVQDTKEDMIIVGFQTYSNWSNVLEEPTAQTAETGVAFIQSGFSFSSLKNLKFSMNAFQNNYVSAEVKRGADKNTRVTYWLILAKLDVSQVGTPTLKGLYKIDPTITIT